MSVIVLPPFKRYWVKNFSFSFRSVFPSVLILSSFFTFQTGEMSHKIFRFMWRKCVLQMCSIILTKT